MALAVLGVALVGALIMGAVVFAVLLGLFAVGYLASLAHAWWRLFRARSRTPAAAVGEPKPAAANVHFIEAEYEVVEAAAKAAPPGSGGTA